MLKRQVCYILVLNLSVFWGLSSGEDVCHADSDCRPQSPFKTRFLLYDVNPPEGFNLRRDVYMRFAILARNLKAFKLVLPPWTNLFHWRSKTGPRQIPWGLYFDIDSLKAFAPVIELYEFFTYFKAGSVRLDEVYILQHFEDMFKTGKFVEKHELAPCAKQEALHYFHYGNITGDRVKCLSYHGSATGLAQFLDGTTGQTVMFHHGEIALHDRFGDKQYWECRRSMRFNPSLKSIAAQFRRQYLNSSDEEDNTVLASDWRDEKPKRDALGGPYVSVHLRRQDFKRRGNAPSLPDVAKQIIKALDSYKLARVFIATDDPSEYNELVKYLAGDYEPVRYTASGDVQDKYGDGGVAILDQIIASFARYFIGTCESTFSFRIQEEREILGFDATTTFNCFCASSGGQCERPSLWKIVH